MRNPTNNARVLLVAVLLRAAPVWAASGWRGPLDWLEDEVAAARGSLPAWTSRLHLSGNADGSLMKGQANSGVPEARVVGNNARLFLDIDVVSFPGLAEVSTFIEWDAVRWNGSTESPVQNKVGALYLRLDRLLGIEALNLKIGRVLIPFGEEYTRFSVLRQTNPLISFSAAAPYGWDDGLLLFGPIGDTRVEYIVGLLTNSQYLNPRLEGQPEFVGKVGWRPVPWAWLSVSGLRTGPLGSSGHPEEASLEFAETSLVAFGDEGDVPSFDHGRPIAPDPSGRVSAVAGEADLVLTGGDWGRFWLAYGHVALNSGGSSRYDRDLTYGIAEGKLGLGPVWFPLEPLYLAARWSIIGTFDPNQGYRINPFSQGEDLGFNTKSASVASLGLGWRVSPHVTIKTEYSWFDFAMVRGVPAELRAQARDHDYFGVGVSLWF